jgi:hypothetical protein
MALSDKNLTGRLRADAELEEWLLCEEARGVRRLRLRNGELGDRSARALAALDGLEALDLGDNLIGEEGALALAASPRPRAALKHLSLYANRVTDRGAAALAAGLPLESLNLCGNRVSVEGLEAIAAATSPRLAKLHLGFLGVGDAGASALGRARWPQLRELNLRLNGLSAAGVGALLRGASFPALEYLGVEENPLGDAIAEALSGVGPRPGLTINLGGTELTEPAARKLSGWGREAGVTLRLHDNLFDEAALSPDAPRLGREQWDWADGLYRTRLLAFHDRGGEGVEYAFETGAIHIGRVAGNELVHPMGNISKRHAAILIDRAGRAFAMDLKSTNGTFLNGRRIGDPAPMRAGDLLYPGGLIVKLLAEPEPLLDRTRRGCATYLPRLFAPWS